MTGQVQFLTGAVVQVAGMLVLVVTRAGVPAEPGLGVGAGAMSLLDAAAAEDGLAGLLVVAGRVQGRPGRPVAVDGDHARAGDALLDHCGIQMKGCVKWKG